MKLSRGNISFNLSMHLYEAGNEVQDFWNVGPDKMKLSAEQC